MRRREQPDDVVDVAWIVILLCVLPLVIVGVAYAAGVAIPGWIFALAVVSCGIAALSIAARLVHRSRAGGRT